MTERQVIVTWYTPEEKMPPEDLFVVVTFSGRDGNGIYEIAMGVATWSYDGLGWLVTGLGEDAEFTIHAWADLLPYHSKGGR